MEGNRGCMKGRPHGVKETPEIPIIVSIFSDSVKDLSFIRAVSYCCEVDQYETRRVQLGSFHMDIILIRLATNFMQRKLKIYAYYFIEKSILSI